MTMAYAEVIGDPIAQSKSPAIHNHWLQALGMTAEYRACHVTPDGLGDYVENRRRDSNWLGCNVTMPHKEAVMPLLDWLDPLAQQIGAVNTVVRSKDGTLSGYNTDVDGFLEPLRDVLGQQHYYRMARIFGTGGAARAIVAALAREGFTLVLAGRNPAKARALLDDLAPGGEHHTPPLAHFAAPTDFAFDDREGCCDLIVNASPLGMAGQAALDVDTSHFPPGSIVYDIVTHPLDTPLLRAARAAGFRTIDGLAMLIGQAALAFEKFYGDAPPRDDGDGTLRRILAA